MPNLYNADGTVVNVDAKPARAYATDMLILKSRAREYENPYGGPTAMMWVLDVHRHGMDVCEQFRSNGVWHDAHGQGVGISWS